MVNSTLTSVAVSVVVVAVVALPHLRHVVGKIAQTMAAGIRLMLRASRWRVDWADQAYSSSPLRQNRISSMTAMSEA